MLSSAKLVGQDKWKRELLDSLNRASSSRPAPSAQSVPVCASLCQFDAPPMTQRCGLVVS